MSSPQKQLKVQPKSTNSEGPHMKLRKNQKIAEFLTGTESRLSNLKPIVQSISPALQFRLLNQYKFARQSVLTLGHGDVDLPIFMPVGTKGTIKGLTSEEMLDINCKILLANTYHLASKPSTPFIDQNGGLHKFMNWPNNILTDSGGFQMVSLAQLCTVDENGVEFEHPNTGASMMMRPEDSMENQNEIQSDIMMALDDVVHTTQTSPERMQEANDRTIRWIDRCFEGHKKQEVQNLFPIVQGGLDKKLRKECVEALVARNAPGYAIGGLSGGEAKTKFVEVVHYTAQLLPKDKPRYLMGVGHPVDILICACLGVDMFDCVFPTRTARFGTAFSKYGDIRLKHSSFKSDLTPINEDCECETCQNYTKAFLNSIATKNEVAAHMLSKHNIHFNLNLMRGLQKAIIEENTEEYVRGFLKNWYRDDAKLPDWVELGLKLSEIDHNNIFN